MSTVGFGLGNAEKRFFLKISIKPNFRKPWFYLKIKKKRIITLSLFK